MEHYGDITKIKGYDVPTVDCVIGGSPCQNLSIAGNRKGLDGDQSVLFLEQIRIIKEMRENDVRNGKTGESVRPRFMVWENVPGAFSSNGGQDFRKVLEETAKIADEDAVIPMPPKNKWTTSGAIMGDGWSIAWRILDAQFWGVPQRRRRIALVADFGGGCAPEILFVKDRLRGDSSESRKERKTASSDSEKSLGADDSKGAICYGIGAYNSKGMLSDNPSVGFYEADTSRTLDNNGGNPACNQGGIAIVQPLGVDVYNQVLTGDKAKTLNSAATDSDHIPCTVYPVNCYDIGDRRTVANESVDVCPTLLSKMGTGGNNVPVISIDRAFFNQGQNALYDPQFYNDGVNPPLVAKGPNALCYGIDDVEYIVRRLTPLEAERLQGFPDKWTDIGEYTDSNGKKKQSSDTARYKALGNSIALPPWKWVLKRLCSHYERDATMASLFDGIGGFPYLWEQINGKGSCLWASEIEDFPIAVTTERIG